MDTVIHIAISLAVAFAVFVVVAAAGSALFLVDEDE
jgi:hypothetical protein